MYNHYTPQSDGSYHRSTRPDPARRPTAPQMNIPVSASVQQQSQQSASNQSARTVSSQPCQNQSAPMMSCGSSGIFSFLRGLLPREIDTADLMVIFLVLLMNREECNDGFSPLLTLALYFLL